MVFYCVRKKTSVVLIVDVGYKVHVYVSSVHKNAMSLKVWSLTYCLSIFSHPLQIEVRPISHYHTHSRIQCGNSDL